MRDSKKDDCPRKVGRAAMCGLDRCVAHTPGGTFCSIMAGATPSGVVTCTCTAPDRGVHGVYGTHSHTRSHVRDAAVKGGTRMGRVREKH